MNPLMILQLVNAGNDALTSFFGAKQQRQDLSFQANMAEINANLYDLKAKDAMQQGRFAEQQYKMKAAQEKGQTRTSAASRGLDLSSGSVVNDLTGQDYIAEMDTNTIQANTIKSAFGYKTEAQNQRSQANMMRTSAKSISPTMAAFNSLLGGATNVASSWYSQKKAGTK